MNTAVGTGVIPIAPWQLALASCFVIAVLILIGVFRLGLAKQYAVAALRTYVQVLLLGSILSWLFNLDSGLAVLGIMLIMTGTAAVTVAKRVEEVPGTVAPVAFVALFAVGLVITFTVTGLIVRVHPWYRPQYVIPLTGMVLGNAMSATAIALERLFRDLDGRADEIRGLIALGATPREAADDSIRASLKAGLIPTISTLATAGIVFIPGMMSGQILAGTAPREAAPYQIVILFMVGAASMFASTIALMLVYRRHFDASGAFVEKARRTD